jgi:tricorn protease
MQSGIGCIHDPAQIRLGALLAVIGLALSNLTAADAQTLLLRTPATNGEVIAFAHGGQLYSVPVHGGIARRLTTGAGYALFPRFSHDGTQLAFTGHYDGNTEVYVMPAEGGPVRRLTWSATLARDDFSDRMGPNNIVLGWRRDDAAIIYRNRDRHGGTFTGDLLAVSPQGGLPAPLPLPHGGFISFAPDGERFAYNRVFREFRTWKRYAGGMADDIWLYDPASGELENLTEHPAQDIIPMWWRDRIYFLSERDGRMNLYALELASRELRQITRFRAFDVKFPSLGGDLLVFENGGRLYALPPATEELREIPVRIAEDFAARRPRSVAAGANPRAFAVFPDGDRVLVGARGDLFSVPLKPGAVRALTRTPGVHDRDPVISPDGASIAWIADTTGEDAIWLAPVAGGEAPRLLLGEASGYLYNPLWSPDGSALLWADSARRLRLVECATGAVREVDHSRQREIRAYDWSPDGRWVAYTLAEPSGISRIWLQELASGARHAVTSDWHDARWPRFSRCGRYLWFTSDRDFSPTFSAVDFTFAYQNMTRVYGVTLTAAEPSPFQPDRAAPPAAGEAGAAAAAWDPAKPLPLEPAGIADRVFALPIQPGEYGRIDSTGDLVLYVRNPHPGDDFSPPGDTPALQLYDLREAKETSLGAYRDYRLSADGKRLFVRGKDGWSHAALPRAGNGTLAGAEPVDLARVRVTVDPPEEWRQIFRESWRQMRDFLYDPGLHGVDWQAVGARYAALLPHVSHRNDLTYLISEMIGELSVGHAYVGGGDRPELPRQMMGLLGAQLGWDAAAGAWRINRILPGENWDAALRSPLTEPGLDIRAGMYLLAVDDIPLAPLANPYAALAGKAGEPVRLRYGAQPDGGDAREVTVVPTADESGLYYEDWVRRNRERVAAATGGRVGYIHIPDMGAGGLNTFVKRYFPQIRKEALIVDVRANGGGFVSPLIIERLRREAVLIDMTRNGTPVVDPNLTLHGPMVCLINEYSASDGDLFPYRFRHHQLGPLIGRRTWGGVVGIRSSLPFMDGGTLHKPEFASYGLDGAEWIIEGVGVAPDIAVDNHPGRAFAGEDQQLETAIEHILEALARAPRPLPPPPPYPIR